MSNSTPIVQRFAATVNGSWLPNARPLDRHRMLFSASANLGEFECPPKLAFALLMPSALDSGLAPADAARQIECGLKKAFDIDKGVQA